MLEDDGRYESLMNTSPLTSSPGASDSLRGLSGAMSQFRSQSRLGMLDTQIGGSRRRPSALPVPDASFNVPTPPDASRGGASSKMRQLEAAAKKAAQGESEFAVAPGTFSVPKGTFAPSDYSVQPGTFTVAPGTFAPMGSTQQAAGMILRDMLANTEVRQQYGMN